MGNLCVIAKGQENVVSSTLNSPHLHQCYHCKYICWVRMVFHTNICLKQNIWKVLWKMLECHNAAFNHNSFSMGNCLVMNSFWGVSNSFVKSIWIISYWCHVWRCAFKPFLYSSLIESDRWYDVFFFFSFFHLPFHPSQKFDNWGHTIPMRFHHQITNA